MTKNKTLLLINDYNLIDTLKKESSITFLFPLEGFSVGYTKTFNIKEINVEGFIFVNRILDNTSIIELKKILKHLPKNIKGIVFDDIGVLNILQELNLQL